MLLVSNLCNEHTMVPNAFIDKYLPTANGDYIKVYLLLLRLNGMESVSVSGMADMLELAEKDVLRALSYWEKQGLIELGYEKDKLVRLVLLESGRAERVSDRPAGEVTTMPARPAEKAAAPAADKKAQDDTPEDPEFSGMIYVCERYLDRNLTRTDTELFTYMYNELHFSADLIEYLVEYCVGAGHRNSAYLRKVAANWAQEGVKDVKSAAEQVRQFADKSRKKAGAVSNRFNNFEQRSGDLNAVLSKGKKR